MSIDLSVEESVLIRMKDEIQQQWLAECRWEQGRIKIYAACLENCVKAAAYILEAKGANQ
jgi:hypothetical protein